MSYNNEEFPKYVKTAGKITVFTAFAGLLVFMVAFVFDIGKQEFNKVSAQTATTTLTVLNTPPSFTIDAYEFVESSTSTPTNSGDNIVWSALGNDSNGAPYFLLVCDTNASPTPAAAADSGSLGTAPPSCGGGEQWGVSASVPSDSYATVTRATTEIAPFGESNDWYAWVCDDDPFNPRCNSVPVQGYSATNSSPFNVNKRPVFSDFANNGPVDPSGVLTFFSTSTDPDSVDDEDELFLVVCSTNSDYNTVTNTCDTNFLASTTLQNILSDASATYTLAAIVQDDTYPAYGYLVDVHGHEASANPIQANFEVNNVAPVVLGGDISLNGGLDMSLTEPAGETTGFTLDYTITDANSCENAAAGAEILAANVAVFRSGVGTSTCDTTATNYDPNNCYPSGIGPATWNLSCSATTTCSGATQDSMDYTCTFPLWFVADPTDNVGTTPVILSAQNWTAAVSGSDDDFATGTLATTSSAVELISFSALEILANDIAYGGVEPGDDTGTLLASSTLQNVGNTGLDQQSQGEAMCGTYSVSTPCPNSASSTIPDNQQKFSSTTLSYASPLAITLSSTTPQEVELDVLKTTSTSTPQEGDTYWGIAVPVSITLAGNYTGLNTFFAKVAEAEDWQ
jgi:hypothetical protein